MRVFIPFLVAIAVLFCLFVMVSPACAEKITYGAPGHIIVWNATTGQYDQHEIMTIQGSLDQNGRRLSNTTSYYNMNSVHVVATQNTSSDACLYFEFTLQSPNQGVNVSVVLLDGTVLNFWCQNTFSGWWDQNFYVGDTNPNDTANHWEWSPLYVGPSFTATYSVDSLQDKATGKWYKEFGCSPHQVSVALSTGKSAYDSSNNAIKEFTLTSSMPIYYTKVYTYSATAYNRADQSEANGGAFGDWWNLASKLLGDMVVFFSTAYQLVMFILVVFKFFLVDNFMLTFLLTELFGFFWCLYTSRNLLVVLFKFARFQMDLFYFLMNMIRITVMVFQLMISALMIIVQAGAQVGQTAINVVGTVLSTVISLAAVSLPRMLLK